MNLEGLLNKSSYIDSSRTCPMKTYLNIRKGSLRFVQPPHIVCSTSTRFNIEFTFDCDIRCNITILHFCVEEVTELGFKYKCKDISLNSKTFQYEVGKNQKFSQVCHLFDPSQRFEEEGGLPIIPVVISCSSVKGDDLIQSHITTARIIEVSGRWHLIVDRQIYFLHGKVFHLQKFLDTKYLTMVGSKFSAKRDFKKPLNCPSKNKTTLLNDVMGQNKELLSNSDVNSEKCQYCANCTFMKKNGSNNILKKDCLVKICKETNLHVTLERLKILEFSEKKAPVTIMDDKAKHFEEKESRLFRTVQRKQKTFSKHRRKSGGTVENNAVSISKELDKDSNFAVKSIYNKEKSTDVPHQQILNEEISFLDVASLVKLERDCYEEENTNQITFENIEIKEEPLENNLEETLPTWNFDDDFHGCPSEQVQNSLDFSNVSQITLKDLHTLQNDVAKCLQPKKVDAQKLLEHHQYQPEIALATDTFDGNADSAKGSVSIQCSFCKFSTPQKSHFIQHLLTHSKYKKLAPAEALDINVINTLCNEESESSNFSNVSSQRNNPVLPEDKLYINSIPANVQVCTTEKNAKLELNSKILSKKMMMKELTKIKNCQKFGAKEGPNGLTYFCLACDFISKKSCAMGNHVKIHNKKYSCPLCKRGCASSIGLHNHLYNHSKSKELCCTNCDFKTLVRYRASYISHLKDCKKQPVFRCVNQCSFKANTIEDFKNHSQHCRHFSSFSSVDKKELNTDYTKALESEEFDQKFKIVSALNFTEHSNDSNDSNKGSNSNCNNSNIEEVDVLSAGKKKLFENDKINRVIKHEICNELKLKSNLAQANATTSDLRDFDCLLCNYSTKNRSNFRNHLFIHSDERLFSCPYCQYQAKQSAGLRAHLKVHNDDKPYHCKLCSYKSKRKQNLVQHSKIHLNDKLIKCFYCLYSCKSKQALQKHAYRKHQFARCSNIVKINSNLIQNIKVESDDSDFPKVKGPNVSVNSKNELHKTIFICLECNFNTPKKCAMGNHIKTHQLKYSCPLCDFKCALTERFRMHLIKHSKHSVLVCSSCNFKTSITNTYITHIKTHKNRKLYDKSVNENLKMYSISFQCKSCLFCTISKLEIQKHHGKCKSSNLPLSNNELTPTIEIPQNIIYLKEHFDDSASSLKPSSVNTGLDTEDHITDHEFIDDRREMHFEIKTEELLESDKLQNDLSQLDVVSSECLEIVNNEPIFSLTDNNVNGKTIKKCDISNIKGCVPLNIDDMKVTAQDNKSTYFECSICDYESTNKSNFRNHLFIHSDERQFSCPYCHYQAKQSAGLRAHLKVHIEDKPFHCNLCSYKCKRSQNLIQHLRIHLKNKLKPFKCSYCTYFCTTKQALEKHSECRHRLRLGPCSDDVEIPSIDFQNLKDHSVKSDYPKRKKSGDCKNLEGELHRVIYVCSECDFDSPKKCAMGNHIKTHLLKYNCPLCDFNCALTERFCMHLRKHSKHSVLVCSYCNFKTSITNTYITHIKSHINRQLCHDRVRENLKMYSMSFQCKSCLFSTISKLEIQKHHGKCKSSNLPLSNNELTPAIEIPQNTIYLEEHFDDSASSLKPLSVSTHHDTENEIYKQISMAGNSKSDDYWVKKEIIDNDITNDELIENCREIPLETKSDELLTSGSLQNGLSQFNFVSSENIEIMNDESTISNSDRDVYGKATKKCDIPNINSFIPLNIGNMKVESQKNGLAHFKCPICVYTSMNKSNFRNHLYIHSDKKQFSCPHCQYQARQSAGLRAHLKVHREEKPYQCKHCSYKCKRKQNLVQHLRIHSMIKNFKCVYCTYRTNTKQSLQKHCCKRFKVAIMSDEGLESNNEDLHRKLESEVPDPLNIDLSKDMENPADNSSSENKIVTFLCALCNFESSLREQMISHFKVHFPKS